MKIKSFLYNQVYNQDFENGSNYEDSWIPHVQIFDYYI